MGCLCCKTQKENQATPKLTISIRADCPECKRMADEYLLLHGYMQEVDLNSEPSYIQRVV